MDFLSIYDVMAIKLDISNIKSAFTHYGYGFTIPESEEYSLMCMESGGISISLICGKLEVLDM